MCVTGGNVCPVDLQKQITSTFAPLHNFWGSTEVGGTLAFGLQPGPVVRMIKDAPVRLVDDKGADVADGEIGELLIRGGNVFTGYWNDPEATAASLKDGWFHTGDLMRRGDGDELWFVSRKKDIVVRGGSNISPVEVEHTLVASHPAVEEAAVIGLPDKTLGQRVFGFVKLADGTPLTVMSEILRVVATQLAAYKVPEGLEVIDKIPRNALEKIDRNQLLTMALAEKAGALQITVVAPRPAGRAAPNR
jgi:long-chain acyl-CoA synthetase